ncbi:hypothetical protein GOV11_00935 [Candidatus Woesearchaeota archaeon]|nr:hypothetical protein [Candidatus Woesearchaeota archaeon]
MRHGWFNESWRHSLAAKGIKTSSYYAHKRFDLREVQRLSRDKEAPIKRIRSLKNVKGVAYSGVVDPKRPVAEQKLELVTTLGDARKELTGARQELKVLNKSLSGLEGDDLEKVNIHREEIKRGLITLRDDVADAKDDLAKFNEEVFGVTTKRSGQKETFLGMIDTGELTPEELQDLQAQDTEIGEKRHVRQRVAQERGQMVEAQREFLRVLARSDRSLPLSPRERKVLDGGPPEVMSKEDVAKAVEDIEAVKRSAKESQKDLFKKKSTIKIKADKHESGKIYPITKEDARSFIKAQDPDNLKGLKGIEFSEPNNVHQKGAWAQYLRGKRTIKVFAQPKAEVNGGVRRMMKEKVLPHELGHHVALYRKNITDPDLNVAEARADAFASGFSVDDKDIGVFVK